MNQETFNFVREESKYIGIIFLISILIFKIIFYKEGIAMVLRTVFSLFYIFVLPGYCLMLYWRGRLMILERIILGIAVSAAIMGIFSYYIGLLGLNIKYHGIIMPAVTVSMGLFINLRK